MNINCYYVFQYRAIIEIFAPFLPTAGMVATIGRNMLEELVVIMTLPELVLDDTAILSAVRVC